MGMEQFQRPGLDAGEIGLIRICKPELDLRRSYRMSVACSTQLIVPSGEAQPPDCGLCLRQPAIKGIAEVDLIQTQDIVEYVREGTFARRL